MNMMQGRGLAVIHLQREVQNVMTGLDLTSQVNYPLECQCLKCYLNSLNRLIKNAPLEILF